MNLNKNIKAFFIDLDGTLLNEKVKDTKGRLAWNISLENKEAIKEVQAQNKKVIVSTGRVGREAVKFAKQVKADYLITGNGALIQDSNLKIIKKFELSLNKAMHIVEFARLNGLILKINGEVVSYGYANFFQKKLSQKFGFPNKYGFNIKYPKNIYKIVLWGKTKGKIQKLISEISNVIPGVESVTSGGWTIEVTAEGVTKGKANSYLAKEVLKLKPATESLHIGDTMNDHTTAKYQRFVVLKNANKKTKSYGTHVADKNTNNGVAKTLRGEYKKIN